MFLASVMGVLHVGDQRRAPRNAGDIQANHHGRGEPRPCTLRRSGGMNPLFLSVPNTNRRGMDGRHAAGGSESARHRPMPEGLMPGAILRASRTSGTMLGKRSAPMSRLSSDRMSKSENSSRGCLASRLSTAPRTSDRNDVLTIPVYYSDIAKESRAGAAPTVSFRPFYVHKAQITRRACAMLRVVSCRQCDFKAARR